MTAAVDGTGERTPGLDLCAFIRATTHEFANPLNAISMNAELIRLLLERGDEARVREALAHVQAECRRFSRLLESYRSFGMHLQARERRETGVRAIIDTAVAAFSPGWNRRARVEVAEGDAIVHVDHVAIGEVLVELMHNATEAGARVVQIAVLTEADTVTVELSDDGPGIASRVRDTLFDPFVTTRRADGATGLGLTLARAVLHAHDGALEAADSPAGARFRLLLPQATPC